MNIKSRIQKLESNIRVVNADILRLIDKGSLFNDLSKSEWFEYFLYYYENESIARFATNSLINAQNLLKTTSNDDIGILITNSFQKPLIRRKSQNNERLMQVDCIYNEVEQVFRNKKESFTRGESNNKYEFLRKYSESEKEILLSMFLILGFD